MEQRFTFIKTNEIKEDFDSEERVEVEVVMEDNDLGQLEEKFSNFLKGCGYENMSDCPTAKIQAPSRPPST